MNERTHKLLELLFQVEGMMHYQMRRGHHRNTRLNPHKGQGRILAILKMKPEVTQKELTYLLDMSKQSLGELLSKLEHAGYITRSQSKEDGRVMVVQLTEAGRNASDEMETEYESTDEIFSCLTEEEQENFQVYLEKVIDAWKQDSEDMNRLAQHHGMMSHFPHGAFGFESDEQRRGRTRGRSRNEEER